MTLDPFSLLPVEDEHDRHAAEQAEADALADLHYDKAPAPAAMAAERRKEPTR